MAFLEDPRLRQRWNQISHTTETVTENAAAGIWSFGHTYINPCLASILGSFESCTSVCLGDREERARRARERERISGNAEYVFDFYDDWDDDLMDGNAGGSAGGGGGLFSGWRHEDWDRLVAGTGRRGKSANVSTAGEISEQPRSRKRGMSYGTRGVRRKGSNVEDPTIIPSTQPIGFLGRLPFKIGGTLRYKPSAANLQDHVGGGKADHQSEHVGETEPLLGSSEDEDYLYHLNQTTRSTRKRSGTTGSGDTSDSYRSRGDLFPSDGEGDEDAVPLDDEFAVALDRVDDRSSNRTRSTKGKRPSDATLYRRISRTVSRATMASDKSRPSLRAVSSTSGPETPIKDEGEGEIPSLKDLELEEERLRRDEDEEVERKRRAAEKLAAARGLQGDELSVTKPTALNAMQEVKEAEEPVPSLVYAQNDGVYDAEPESAVEEDADYGSVPTPQPARSDDAPNEEEFVPARLPYFR